MEDCKDVLVSASEFVKDRLYFVTLRTSEQPKSTQFTHYFSVDGELSYESFFDDFGPFNISMLYHYCTKLNRKLNCTALEKKKIVHTTSNDPERRVNAAYLIGCYAIIYLNFDAQKAYDVLCLNTRIPYINFRDASNGQEGYTISLLDCLRGLHKAFHYGFFDFSSFNDVHYEHYERVENGDLNWIVPGKFLGFCGPHNKARNGFGFTRHSPEFYFKYFHRNNVTSIIRLNKRIYDANKFLCAGFQHHDLYFIDGGTPTDRILNEFLSICERTEGAIAVHCKAGLGRTGTLIGCYLMKHYQFTAHEAIGWIRICRPGSVIGHQQAWMERKQEQMWRDGDSYRRRRGITTIPKLRYGIYCKRIPRETSADNGRASRINDRVTRILKKVDTMQLNDSADDDSITQGDQLNQIKAKRQCHLISNPPYVPLSCPSGKTRVSNSIYTERRIRSQLLVNSIETSSLTKVGRVLTPAAKSSSTSNSRVLFSKRNETSEQQLDQHTQRRMSQRKATILKAAVVTRNFKPKLAPKKNENGWILEENNVKALADTCNGEKKDIKTKRGKRALNLEKDKASNNPRSVKVLRRSHVSIATDGDIKNSTKLHLPLVKHAK